MIPDCWKEELPLNIGMRVVMFGDGAKGSYMQIHACESLGIQRLIVRPSRSQDAVQTFTCDKFPSTTFPTLRALREAWNADVPIRRCGGWQPATGAGQPCSRCTRYAAGEIIKPEEEWLVIPDFIEGECPLRIPPDPEDVS